MAKKQTKDAQVITQDARIYINELQIKSDLFKLEVATCNLNKGWNDAINLESVEHVHFFHTYDSDGKLMGKREANGETKGKTNSVAGHFHEIVFEDRGPNKPVEIISVSGPMREVKRRVRGKWVRVVEPIDPNLDDSHTHDVIYRRTENVKMREVVPEAVNMAAQEAQKTAAIPGISSN